MPSDIPPPNTKHCESLTDLPLTGRDPYTEVETWKNIRGYFAEQLESIKRLRKEKGFPVASAQHEELVREYDDYNTWDRLFEEGIFRNSATAEIIEGARMSYYEFLEPLKPERQERMNMLQGLYMKIATPWRQIMAGRLPDVNEIEFSQVFREVESYNDLYLNDPEAKAIIDKILTALGNIADYKRRNSK